MHYDRLAQDIMALNQSGSIHKCWNLKGLQAGLFPQNGEGHGGVCSRDDVGDSVGAFSIWAVPHSFTTAPLCCPVKPFGITSVSAFPPSILLNSHQDIPQLESLLSLGASAGLFTGKKKNHSCWSGVKRGHFPSYSFSDHDNCSLTHSYFFCRFVTQWHAQDFIRKPSDDLVSVFTFNILEILRYCCHHFVSNDTIDILKI